MKNHTKIPFLLLLTGLSIFASCSKKESTSGTSVSVFRCYPTDIIHNKLEYQKNIYTGNNLLIEQDQYDSMGMNVVSSVKFFYNSSRLESKAIEYVNGVQHGYYIYDYQGNELTLLHYFDSSSTETWRTRYTWVNNMIIADSTADVSSPKWIVTSYHTYAYDKKGNLAVIKTHLADTSKMMSGIWDWTEYKYDTFPNPFKGLVYDGYNVLNNNTNNITTTTYKSSQGQIDYIDSKTYYSYNKNGFPTSNTYTDFRGGGKYTQENLVYLCK